MRWLGGVVGVSLAVASACGTAGQGTNRGPDGFSGGKEPLVLTSAHAGICDGDGANKECSSPGNCQPSGAAPGSGPGSPSVGSAGASAGAGAGGWTGASAGGPSLGPPALDRGTGASTGGRAAAAVDAGRQAAIVDAGTRGVASCGDAGDAAACGVGTTIARISQPLLSACAGLEGATPAKLYLSADDSNSMASPVIARRLIRSGGDVPPSIVRPYEFLNYYDFSFEPAAPGEVRIVPQLSSCPSDGKLSLQIALQAEHRDPGARRPLSLTFVLDTSGSMQGQPVALERAAVRAVARRLRSGDVVSMVTWNTSQRELMAGHTVAGPDDPELLAAVAALGASGGTDLNGGLRRGYELAEQYYAPDRINRIVLISDGIANVGVTEEAIIGAHASDEEGQSGIYLAGVGVGAGVNDTLMNVVTDAGRGAYVYLDSEAEAERMLGEHLLEVVDVAARSVRLEVTLPWYLQVKKFYGEQISTNAAKVRPQHLGPDSAMLFFQILGSCDPSLIHGDDRILIRATWETPFERVSKASVIDTTLNALAGDDAALTKGAAVAGYAEALVLVGLRPRQEHAGILRRALGAVTAARGAGRDPDLVEIEELLRAYLVRHGG